MSKKPKFVDNVDRKKWDLKEYEERARKRAEFGDDYFDKQEKSSTALVLKKKLQERGFEVDIYKKVGKHEVISSKNALSNRGGFYCETCDCVLKDHISYLDHINGRKHQKKLGMGMIAERATLSEVKGKLESLKRKKEEEEKGNDVEARMAKYEASLQNRKKRKKNKREKEKERKREEQAEEEGPAVDPLMAAMGFNFASFGSSKKK